LDLAQAIGATSNDSLARDLLDLVRDPERGAREMSSMVRWTRRAGSWFALALCVPVLLLGVVSFVRRAEATEPRSGVEWIESETGPVALEVDPEGAAARAGLRAGDLVLELDGRGVASALDLTRLGWGSSTSILRVRRGGSERVLPITPRHEPRGEPYAYLALVGLAFWVSGVFIAWKWPAIRGGGLYPLLALSLFAHLALSRTGQADTLDRIIDWTDLLAGALGSALLVHLGITIARPMLRRPRLTAASAYAFVGAGLLASAWVRPDALGGSYRFGDPRLAVEVVERVEPALLSLAWVITTVLVVKALFRTSSLLHRSQLRWLLWGLALGLGPFVLLYAVPFTIGAAELPAWAEFLAVAPIVLVPGSFTAALARYRLDDLDVFLVRGFAEVSALFGAFAVLAGAVFVLREGVAELLPMTRGASRYVGFLAAAISYPQLRVWSRAAVERAFYRRRYSYRATLLEWARELNAETDLSSLVQRLRARIRDTLGIPRAEVWVCEGARFRSIDRQDGVEPIEIDEATRVGLEREAHRVATGPVLASAPWARYLFPMRVKGVLRAVLAVAERPEPEEPLSSEDRALLGTLAAHAATAIEAARLFHEVRRRADEIERLHAREARILETSAVGLLLVDGDSRIQVWNRALEAIYGLPREQAIGRRLVEVLPLHVARRIERESEPDAQSADTRIFRLSLTNRRDERRLVNLSITWADAEGDRGARVVTFDDVTERVAFEEQSARQERLASLGLLAAGVAHEINTPLTGISSYAQLLLDDLDDDDRRKEILRKIEQQTERAAGITRSLLNLARPEGTAPESVDLNRTIQEVLQLFEPQVRRSGLRLVIALADDLPPVRGNRGKLQQVILNLLLNARDALREEGTITVSSACRDGKAVFEIMDDGIGIAEDDLPRIFDPFFTTKGRAQGTGLGLAISYGIVREHRGEIHVESQAGRFTRFRVELPLVGSARAMA
jgi:PAS domain S-box-containing protein